MRLHCGQIPGALGAGLTCLLAILSLQSLAEPQEAKPVLRLQTSAGEVTCLGFSPKGELFFAGSLDSWVFFWERGNWKTVLTLKPPAPTKAKMGEHQPEFRESTACAISSDDKQFALASGGSLDILALPSGAELRDMKFPAHALAYSPDGKVLAAGYGSTVQLWETRSWHVRARWHLPESGVGTPAFPAAISAIAFSPGGHMLALANDHGAVATWRVGSSGKPHFFSSSDNNVNESATAVTFSPDGHFLASSNWGLQPDQNVVRVWEVDSGRQVGELRGHNNHLGAAAFSPDGRHLASGDVSGLVHIWDTVTWKKECTIQTDGLYAIAYSPDSNWLVTGGGDQNISIWKNPVCPKL